MRVVRTRPILQARSQVGPRIQALLSLLLTCGIPLAAQTISSIAAAGYDVPQHFRVARGQIVTLFVRGVRPVRARAVTMPLPSSLEGISILRNVGVSAPDPIPIFALEPIDPTTINPVDCARPCQFTAVTVQIPYEFPGLEPPNPPAFVNFTLTAVDRGVAGEAASFRLASDAIHLLHAFDSVTRPFLSEPPIFDHWLITHADGSRVTATNPARPGEVVVLYAVGLGGVAPRVPTGTAAPPAPAAAALFLQDLLALGIQYQAFSPPTRPLAAEAIKPDFAGLTPGFVGLYQVNFKLPEAFPPNLAPCLLPEGKNATITLSGPESLDAAYICLRP